MIPYLASTVKRKTVDIPPPPATPRDYYISATGTGDGLSSGNPAPLSTFMSATLVSGDRLYLKAGDEFVMTGKTFPVDNIIVQPFGSGGRPTMIGSEYYGGATWTNEGDGSWSTPIVTEPKWVYINDQEAKQAETDWIPITSSVSAQVRRVSSATINAFPSSIVGAYMIAKEFSFRPSVQLTVSGYNSTNGNITFTGTLVGAAAGMPLKLSNQRQFMSAEGDWCWVSGRLYVQSSTTPAGTNIRVGTNDYSFFVNASAGCAFHGIKFKHYFKYGILATSSDDFLIDDCEVEDNRGEAFRMDGQSSEVTFTNNIITRCGLRGVEQAGINGGTFSNNTISFIDTAANRGRPWDQNKSPGTGIGLITVEATQTHVSDNLVMENNLIHDVGYCGIQYWGNDNQFRYNHIYNYNYSWSDGGGIYCFYGNYLGLNSSTDGNLAEYNIIHDNIGNVDGITSGAVHTTAGIYHDSGTSNNTAQFNIIYNSGEYGIFCNVWGTGHIIKNNKIAGATVAQVEIREHSSGNPNFDIVLCRNCIMTDNELACKTSTARCFSLFNYNNNSTFDPFDDTDNNHFVQPYASVVATRTQNSGSSFTDMTLAQWRTYIGDDAASTARVNWKVTPDSDDVLVEDNTTDSPVNFNVPGGYSDYNGNAFSNPVSIPAWYGLIYYQN